MRRFEGWWSSLSGNAEYMCCKPAGLSALQQKVHQPHTWSAGWPMNTRGVLVAKLMNQSASLVARGRLTDAHLVRLLPVLLPFCMLQDLHLGGGRATGLVFGDTAIPFRCVRSCRLTAAVPTSVHVSSLQHPATRHSAAEVPTQARALGTWRVWCQQASASDVLYLLCVLCVLCAGV